MPALDALDETLGAQLLVGTADPRTYDFTHALVRHTLYDALNPSRQARLHRDIAEAMEQVYGERAGEHAAEIARHYHRSASLPGAEHGVPHCLAAAELAERSSAFADAAAHLRAALELLPESAPERPRLMARLALALVWTLQFGDAVAVACDTARRIAEAEGREAAADHLGEVAMALSDAGGRFDLGPLVRKGLDYTGARRDGTWAILKALAIREKEISDPTGLGIPLDTAERREVAALFEHTQVAPGLLWGFIPWASRAEIVERNPESAKAYAVGDYRCGLPLLLEEACECEGKGKIGRAVALWAGVSRFHTALGEFDRAREARLRAAALAERLAEPAYGTAQLVGAADEWRMAMDEGWDDPMESAGPGIGQGRVLAWYRAGVRAAVARTHARMGRVEPAMRGLTSVLPAIEGGPSWAENYTRIACDAAETLWLTQRTDHIDVIERNLREKVVEPDFRYPMMDGRLALARLCTSSRAHDEHQGRPSTTDTSRRIGRVEHCSESPVLRATRLREREEGGFRFPG